MFMKLSSWKKQVLWLIRNEGKYRFCVRLDWELNKLVMHLIDTSG